MTAANENTANDKIFTLSEVVDRTEGFELDLVSWDIVKSNPSFKLEEISISKVLDHRGDSIMMTEDMIEENNDSEYIQSMTQCVIDSDQYVFEPVVVIDRESHYEWLDGQHRMTALSKAGYNTVIAYVGVVTEG